MVGGPSLYLMLPLPLPQASIDLTTLYEATSPSGTPPKTTCLPSSHEVTTVVMKNCEPLLEDVSSCVVLSLGARCLRVGAGVGHGQEEGLVVGQLEVLVAELFAVDGLSTRALVVVSCLRDRIGAKLRTLPRVKSPPWSMNCGITRWNFEFW
jgi:hypothetical protein